MNHRIFKFLKEYSFDPFRVDRLIVSTYIEMNHIKVKFNKTLQRHLISQQDTEEKLELDKFIEIIKKEQEKLNFEDLIRLFEFVISPAEKEVNGAVYTPDYIRHYIVKSIVDNISDEDLPTTKFADIACGCGGFFYTLAELINKKNGLSFYDIFLNNIYGVDIQSYSINRTKLLLILLAIKHGEDREEFGFNLYVGNSLGFDWNKIESIKNNGGFDVIIGNPPYVSSSKIDEESKKLLENWSVTEIGKPDLYIPFFQIGIENLRPGGILGYITVNNFYRSLNGRGIRTYFSKNRYPITLIDFGAEQVFRGRSTYTCICFIKREEKGNIKYFKTKSQDIKKIKNSDYILVNYEDLSDKEGWLLENKKISRIIKKIESTGIRLGECFDIRNGFATLKNDVFVFSPYDENETEYFFIKDGIEYRVEKQVCKDVIKPNTLKSEGEIVEKIEKLIFPYHLQTINNLFSSENTVQLMEENFLRENFPLAFRYLQGYKQVLSKRDKGKREYGAWYAFGRTQALNIQGFKLLFPYISDSPYFVYSNQVDLLFYNGYALVGRNEQDLLVVQKVLSSKLFWFYIKYTSKPYGSEYYALAKNYVKNFGVYQFNEQERQFLLETQDKEIIERFLCNLYGVNI